MKLDLETLKYVKDVFNLHSDTSCLTNGYKNLLEIIKQEETKQLTLTDVGKSFYCASNGTGNKSPLCNIKQCVYCKNHENLQ